MPDWPEWTESLRPDEITSARLRRAILEAAAPLLDARRDDWWDVASRWAGLLTPIGVAATLAFAAMAVGNGTTATTSTIADAVEGPAPEGSADVFEALRTELAPAGFSADAGADESFVFAAMGAADRGVSVERPAPRGSEPGER